MAEFIKTSISFNEDSILNPLFDGKYINTKGVVIRSGRIPSIKKLAQMLAKDDKEKRLLI